MRTAQKKEEPIMDGFLFFGVGLLLVAVGVFHRRSLFRAYASDRKQYTGTTP